MSIPTSKVVSIRQLHDIGTVHGYSRRHTVCVVVVINDVVVQYLKCIMRLVSVRRVHGP